MNSQRFFIALVPPPEIQALVNQVKRYFQSHYGAQKALNSPPHITLQAPFEWSSDRNIEALTDGLKKFAEEKEGGAISLRNFGAFPPKVIYIDVVQTPNLMDLQQDLAQFVERTYGFVNRRYQNFCPHMTVAFRDLTKTAFDQAWPEFSQKPFELDFVAKELTLLRHNGQQWQIYQNYSFR